MTTRLTADALKDALWQTLQAVKNRRMQPDDAHAISSQAREIIKTVNLQLRVGQIDRELPKDVKIFCTEKSK